MENMRWVASFFYVNGDQLYHSVKKQCERAIQSEAKMIRLFLLTKRWKRKEETEDSSAAPFLGFALKCHV